jgi:glycosyltransferase involved in cell wall biosynthesis
VAAHSAKVRLNILINAASIKEGGSKVVLLRLLEEFTRLRPQDSWYVAVHPLMATALPEHPAVFPIPVAAAARSPLHLRLWYETSLLRLIGTHHVDLVFSQTNYLPSRRLACPTLLLVQHAGHFSKVFRSRMALESRSALKRLAFRATGRWVRRSVKAASRVTVQTSALATEILYDVGVPAERMVVIPHGPGLAVAGAPRLFAAHDVWRIGYVTKYGVQKNFEALLRAIAILRKSQTIELILTLDERAAGFQKVAAAIERLGLGDIVRNYGEIPASRIEGLYDSLDIFVFASVCESFGFPLVEAMAHGLPIIAADIASTREIGGQALEYFAPGDFADLARKIEQIMVQPAHYNAMANRSALRSRDFDWARSAQENLALMDQLVGAARSSS